MNYFLGAYHLLKLKPLDFGAYKGEKILTGSRCLNDSYFDAWSLTWTEDGKHKIAEAQKEFGLTEAQIQELRGWADQKFEEERLGWINTFRDTECLLEYKNRFFPQAKDFEVLAIYFPEDAIDDFIQEFEPKSAQTGSIGILNNLKQKIPEQAEETCIGYELIGMEPSGDYHSFHCYDISQDLREKFYFELNEYGLIREVKDKDKLLAYANDPDKSKLPFVPWYLVKVKKISID
ncbi:MAG: hypothetical protein AAFR87_03165 [Bacteroidota bacterium]